VERERVLERGRVVDGAHLEAVDRVAAECAVDGPVKGAGAGADG
jgi:hypothetical protein